tara:strand:+ start:672 stop:1409 length:738 start_codon:yes stop_codon:yes gene_type:complete
MSYARLPQIPEDTQEVEEKKIFKKVDTIETTQPKGLTEAEEKKKSLKEHLARCREKSIATRKKNAEIKKANKKPRGRPKKSPLTEEDTPEFKPNIQLEVVEEYDEKTHRINEVEPKKVEEVAPKEVVAPIAKQTTNNMDLDYEKLADMVAGRLKPPTPPITKPTTPQIPQTPMINNQQEVGTFLTGYADMIRQNERQNINKEKEQRQQQNLEQATKSYYGKLPPVSLIKSDNAWDNLFNGGGRRN